MNRCFTEVRFFKWREDEIGVSLRNRSGSYGGGSEVLVVYALDHVICQGGNCTAQGKCYYEEVCPTLKSGGVHGIAMCQKVTGTLNPGAHAGSYNGQDAYNDLLVVEDGNDNDESQLYAHGWDNRRNGEFSLCDRPQRPTDSNGHRGGETMVEPTCMSDKKGHNGITSDGTATTLTAQEKERPLVGMNCVRRLTPMECERLQGFPDGWTNIGDYIDTNGKQRKTSDSARYKALGNSIALPFWDWLLGRISAQYERPATLGSLFDGIGGFPLCWERYNGKGTALWASEIEEFPIAVTKYHFPEEKENEKAQT